MRLNLRKLVLGAAIALLPQLMIAQDVSALIPDDGGAPNKSFFDVGVNGNIRMKSSTVPIGDFDPWLARPQVNIGGLRQYIADETDPEKLADYDGIMVIPFQIPEMPAGKKLTSVSFSAYQEKVAPSWGGLAIDVYALDTRDDFYALATDFYVGESTAAPAADFLIQSEFIVKGDAVVGSKEINEASKTALTEYFNNEYTSGNAGKYTFIRLNFKTPETPTYNRIDITSADAAANQPKLVFTFEDIVTEGPVLGDIQDVVASTVSSTSVALNITSNETTVVTVLKADGTDADGVIVEKHWNGSIDFVTIDGSVATAGDYDVTVTDANGLKTTKTLKLIVEDGATTSVSGRNWPNREIGDNTGVFTKTIYATPNGSDLDAGITMSEGVLDPDSWGSCSVIVRFKPDGTFDAHDGTRYTKDADVSYISGVKYKFDFTVDVDNKKYTVSITPEGGTTTVLAADYGFRNQNVTKLDHVMLAAYIRSYTLDVNEAPILADIEDVVSSTISSTTIALDVTDANQEASSLIVSVKKADGTDADGMLIEKHWNGTVHFVTVDGSIATAGDYEVTVTDDAGATATKTFKLSVDDTGAFISGRNWPNAEMGDNTGVFTKTVYVTPNGSDLDAGVTMSEGVLGPDSWGSCSVIVRFKPDGTFDAHDGTRYTKDADISYTAGVKYKMDFTVDIDNKEYTVSITPEGGATTVLATDYGFRNQNITKLDHVMLAAYIRSYTLTFDDGLSNNELDTTSLSVYPNPAVNGLFNVELPNSLSVFTLEVVDFSGKVMYNKEFSQYSKTITVSDANLNSGLYIVKVISNDTTFTSKLIVE